MDPYIDMDVVIHLKLLKYLKIELLNLNYEILHREFEENPRRLMEKE